MRLLLKHLVWATDAGDTSGDLRLQRGRIVQASRGLAPRRRERVLDLTGYRALPGLINGHDHLSLNLLPHLGEPPYPSIYRFAEAIYRPERSPIREIESVAIRDRLAWGGYKNLISGVTTVVHHDPLPRSFFFRDFPVGVLRRYAWCHSLRYGDPAAVFARARQRPFIVHAAEGVDEESFGEIERLERLGVLDPRTVIVHGIALTTSDRRRLASAGASLVWCPVSNLRLYGQTARVDALRGSVRVALGTDSTLTGSPTLLAEARAAAATGLATESDILRMVTIEAAAIFGLRDRGWIGEGAVADLTVVPEVASTGGRRDPLAAAAASLLAARPADLALVLVRGRPRLAAPAVADRLELGPPNGKLRETGRRATGRRATGRRATGRRATGRRDAIDERPIWLTGNPSALKKRIVAVTGAQVLDAHPLWQMLSAGAPGGVSENA